MRISGILLVLLPFLAGCALFGGRDDPSIAAEAERPSIAWHTRLADDVVQVEVTDPNGHYRVQRVVLAAPDGRIYEAAELTRETIREDDGYGRGGGVGVGIGGGFGSGGSSSVGIGLSFPMILGGSSRRQPVVTRTTARIPLLDPAAYWGHAEDWIVTIHLVDAEGNESLAQIPAPKTG